LFDAFLVSLLRGIKLLGTSFFSREVSSFTA